VARCLSPFPAATALVTSASIPVSRPTEMGDRSRVYRLSIADKQPLRPTQPPILSETANEYRPRAAAVFCGWEDNRRCGFVLTMRQRLWYIHLRAQWPIRKGVKHPAYTLLYDTIHCIHVHPKAGV